MKSIGIIAEFNPLHNGHVYLINEAKRLSNADICIIVMSGNISMRGEISPIDKFSKTRFALMNGGDLVVELPSFFTIQNADEFSYRGIEILHHLQVDEIYFGSESNDLERLKVLSNISDSDKFNDLIRNELDKGISYKKASCVTFERLGFENVDPNDVLAFSYIKAIDKLKSKIKPCPIKRLNSNYNDVYPTNDSIASATAIKSIKNISNYVPSCVLEHYERYGFMDWDKFFPLLSYKINSTTRTELLEYFGVVEGLDGAIINANLTSFNKLLESLVSKRFTKSRIRRILCSLFFNMNKTLKSCPPYIRILGMNHVGKTYLNQIKKEINIPLISKISAPLNPLLELELRISKIYSACYHKNIIEEEYKPIILD